MGGETFEDGGGLSEARQQVTGPVQLDQMGGC